MNEVRQLSNLVKLTGKDSVIELVSATWAQGLFTPKGRLFFVFKVRKRKPWRFFVFAT